MSKKFTHYFYSHPIKCVVFACILLSIWAALLGIISEIARCIIVALLVLIMLTILLVVCYKDQKAEKKLQSMEKEDYEKVWKKYVDLVEKTCQEQSYDRSKLNCNWVERFNELIYSIAADRNILRRKFSDFDIAASLIYSLTWEDEDNGNLIFSLECVKHLLSSPNIYSRYLGYGNELELEVESTLRKVDFNFYDENITLNALSSIIEVYLTQKTTYGIVLLSDFLYILYLKCN